jgi:hypothetical protein
VADDEVLLDAVDEVRDARESEARDVALQRVEVPQQDRALELAADLLHEPACLGEERAARLRVGDEQLDDAPKLGVGGCALGGIGARLEVVDADDDLHDLLADHDRRVVERIEPPTDTALPRHLLDADLDGEQPLDELLEREFERRA